MAEPGAIPAVVAALQSRLAASAPTRVAVVPSDWPALDPAALHGLAGDVVRALDPHTEADPAAVLASLLVCFGSAVGRAPHRWADGSRHGANEFVAVVGNTSRSRKGTSLAGPMRLMELADPAWARECQASGLGSGEGLVWRVRDSIEGVSKKGEHEVVDGGVGDKRLLLVEEELSLPLKASRREGSIVGDNLRKAWDARRLENTVKGSPVRATDPHVSVLGHVTREELARVLDDTAMANGLGNRFLWVAARRSKLLPNGGRLPDAEARALADRLREALDHGRRAEAMRRDPDAEALWSAVYPELTADRPGLFGTMTARSEAHVLRLETIYALLDCSDIVLPEHTLAALAFWRYCEDSVRLVFGDRTGDDVADRILAALRNGGSLTETQISGLFHRNVTAARLDRAQRTLLAAGLIAVDRLPTGGRAATVWCAT